MNLFEDYCRPHCDVNKAYFGTSRHNEDSKAAFELHDGPLRLGIWLSTALCTIIGG